MVELHGIAWSFHCQIEWTLGWGAMSQIHSNSSWLLDQQRSNTPFNEQQMKDGNWYRRLTPAICPTEYHWLVYHYLDVCIRARKWFHNHIWNDDSGIWHTNDGSDTVVAISYCHCRITTIIVSITIRRRILVTIIMMMIKIIVVNEC